MIVRSWDDRTEPGWDDLVIGEAMLDRVADIRDALDDWEACCRRGYSEPYRVLDAMDDMRVEWIQRWHIAEAENAEYEGQAEAEQAKAEEVTDA